MADDQGMLRSISKGLGKAATGWHLEDVCTSCLCRCIRDCQTRKELAIREKEAGIYPEAGVDCFMKATTIEGYRSSLITYYTLRILGLDVCRDTFVGDQTRRDIFGGQKKRATTGEMLVGPEKTLFIDEISTGLDSFTTFQIVKCMQQIAHLNESTIFMSLLQQSSDQQPSTLEDSIISECCGLNVTQEEQGHMAEGDSDGKVEAGYDSPFEDGELREPIGWEDSQVKEKETVDCVSVNINKADSGTMETPSSERVDHGAQADICEKKHIDEPAKGFSERKDGKEESRSFDVCRNGAYVPQSRNSSLRVWDEKSNGSLDSRSNHYRNYNPYRSQYRRTSPSERNNGYNRGPLARRSHSRDRDHDRYNDRYRQEYRDPKPCYLERKQHSINFNRPTVAVKFSIWFSYCLEFSET
ncbi:ABC transporter G family member 35-like protein [Tanacetum coccineum]